MGNATARHLGKGEVVATAAGPSGSPVAREARVPLEDDDDDEQPQFLPPCIVRPAVQETQTVAASHHYEFELPSFVPLTVEADVLLMYQRKVDQLSPTLPSDDKPYERGLPTQAPFGVSLGPEESGEMLRVTSCVVPSPSVPYQPPVAMAKLTKGAPTPPPPPPFLREKLASNLQYRPCGQCKAHIYGMRYDCNNCIGHPSFAICEACYQHKRFKHGNCRCNDYFQGYSTTINPDRTQFFLFRYYSAVISMPQDYMVLAWAPAFPHYQEGMKIETMYVPSRERRSGDSIAIPLWTHQSRHKDVVGKDPQLLADFDLAFYRTSNAYTLDFTDEAASSSLTLRVVLPLVLLHASLNDVRSCMGVSRTWYQLLKDSAAMCRARIQHIAYDQAEEAVTHLFKGSWVAAWRELQSTRKYVRLMAMRCSVRQEPYLVLDVNMSLWRRVSVCRVPNTKAALEAQAAFLKNNPGYID